MSASSEKGAGLEARSFFVDSLFLVLFFRFFDRIKLMESPLYG